MNPCMKTYTAVMTAIVTDIDNFEYREIQIVCHGSFIMNVCIDLRSFKHELLQRCLKYRLSFVCTVNFLSISVQKTNITVLLLAKNEFCNVLKRSKLSTFAEVVVGRQT